MSSGLRPSSFCVMDIEPSVATVRICVSPRWKSAEPCVRGSSPTSLESGRTSVSARPSGRLPSLMTLARTVFFSTSSNALATALASYCSLSCSMASCSACLMPSLRSPRPSPRSMMLSSAGRAMRSMLDSSSGSEPSENTTSVFGLPASATILSCRSMILTLFSWPMRSASRMTSSLTSFAPASIMMTASRLPAMVRSSLPSATCS